VTYSVIDVKDLEGRRTPVARALGAVAIKADQFDSQPHQVGHEHDELAAGQEEIYVALRGAGHLEIDGEKVESRTQEEAGDARSHLLRATAARETSQGVRKRSAGPPDGERPADRHGSIGARRSTRKGPIRQSRALSGTGSSTTTGGASSATAAAEERAKMLRP
jgi:hypothetical protein